MGKVKISTKVTTKTSQRALKSQCQIIELENKAGQFRVLIAEYPHNLVTNRTFMENSQQRENAKNLYSKTTTTKTTTTNPQTTTTTTKTIHRNSTARKRKSD